MLSSKPRHAEVLKTAASLGGYAPFASETAQGIALHETGGAVVAMLAEVSITSDQEVKVDRVICAVDCGRVINPDLVRQQIEGGIVFALTGAVKGGDRKSVVSGQRVPVRVDLGGRRIIKKQKKKPN